MEKKFLLIEGTFAQCGYATFNYGGDPNAVYCGKYSKVMYVSDGWEWTIANCCRGYTVCDRFF